MKPRLSGIVLALVAAGSLAVIWLPQIPLGIPGEWEWPRIPFETGQWLVLAFGLFIACVIGAAYVGFVALGAARIATSRGETAAWLAGLTAAGFVWLWAAQESPASKEFTLAKSGLVLYYHGTEGYFEQARYVMKDVPSYLAGYESRMAEGDVLHLGTHPPGLILFHRACINACAQFPALREFLLATQAASFKDAIDTIAPIEERGRHPITANDQAALWLAVLITQLIAAATVVPLYLLARRTNSPQASWWAAALWPLVPALAIFLPKSDAFFPFLGCLVLWLWLEGFRRRSVVMCALAGVVFWLAMFLSLAILPVALAAGLLTLWEVFVCQAEERTQLKRRGWPLLFAAPAAVFIAFTLLPWLFGYINLPAVWRWNYRNHAAFYHTGPPRIYWKWLLINPLELSLALGVPIVLAAAWAFRSRLTQSWRSRSLGPYCCLTATWMVLWLSGKNSGEAARLWLVIMPWFVWMTTGFFGGSAPTNRVGGASQFATRAAVALVVLQMVVCLGTVIRVTGFDFAP